MRDDNVRSGNDRHANIARWIEAQRWHVGQVPHDLVLLCWVGDGEERDTVLRIPFEEVTADLGYKLSEQIDSYANDAGQHCKARLEFRDATNTELIGKGFRGLCKRGSEVLGFAAQDGSMVSILTQTQNNLHAVTGKLLAMVEIVEARGLQHLEVVERLITRVENTHMGLTERERQRAEEAEARAQEAEALANKAAEVAEENAKAVEEAQQNDRVGQVIDIMQRKLLQDSNEKK